MPHFTGARLPSFVFPHFWQRTLSIAFTSDCAVFIPLVSRSGKHTPAAMMPEKYKTLVYQDIMRLKMISESTLAISSSIITVIVVIIIAYSIKKLLTDTIVNNFARSVKLTEHDLASLKKIFAVIIYLAAFIYILSIFQLQAPLLALLSGAGFAGIVIGFAAKDVIANFIGGIILLMDRPFKIGDVIEIDNVVGKVSDISVRTTVLMTADGEYVTIPNANIMVSVIKNRSAPDSKYRIRVPISVDYKTDITKLNKVVVNTLSKLDYALETPPPELIFRSFGSSSIDFDAAFWIDIVKSSFINAKGDAAQKLKVALDKAGIKMPYPHVEIVKGK